MKLLLMLAWAILVLFFEPHINQADIDQEETLEMGTEEGVEGDHCNDTEAEQIADKERVVKDVDCYTGNGTHYRGNQ